MKREQGFLASKICTCVCFLYDKQWEITKIIVMDINIKRKVIAIVNLLDELK